MHLRSEAIALPGNGCNKAVLAASLPKDAAQRGNHLVQIVLFDDGIGPDSHHQVFLFDHLAIARNQQKERVEGFRRDGDETLPAKQQTLSGVNAEVRELEDVGQCIAQVDGLDMIRTAKFIRIQKASAPSKYFPSAC